MQKTEFSPLTTALPLEIVGSFRAHTELGRQATAYMVEQYSNRSFPGEIPHSPERLEQLAAMDQALLAFGRDVGVELTDNLPPASIHHFFKDAESLKEALRSLGITPADDQEGQCNSFGIFAIEQKDLFDTLNTVSHERFHFVDKSRVALRHDGGDAYTLNPIVKSTGLNEIITDIRTIHLMKGGYWDAQPNLPKRYNIYGYTSLDVLGDELIQASAEKQELEPITLLQGLERDAFMGESNGLRRLLAPFGTHAKKLFVQLNHQDPMLARELAFDFGLPEAAVKMDALQAGIHTSGILDWVDINKESKERSLRAA
jgi:hypothetical protein